MDKKNYFTRQAKDYAAFRPTYPEELYRFILEHLQGRSSAWDCGTGNGQVARVLAAHFDNVQATDVSQKQLDYAFRAPNIFYSLTPAEKTSFEEGTFDLITVAQAAHWFDLNQFYREVRRTARRGAVIAIWGYSHPRIDVHIDEHFLHFYHHQAGPYWDPARKLVENHYRDLPFPFEEIASPDFTIARQWEPDDLAGYLNSWSAVQKYIASNGGNPIPAFMDRLKPFWRGGEVKTVRFPVFLRLGRVSEAE